MDPGGFPRDGRNVLGCFGAVRVVLFELVPPACRLRSVSFVSSVPSAMVQCCSLLSRTGSKVEGHRSGEGLAARRLTG